jgi:hypothetical protein
MRDSTLYLGCLSVLVLLFGGMMFHARYGQHRAVPVLKVKARMVRELELSDLCIFTEASYTRHPSQTDLATPFQDSPGAFEHFPSGMLAEPAPHLRNHGAGLKITRNHVNRH